MQSVDPDAIDLTESQFRVLSSLIELYGETDVQAVKGRRIADSLNRNPGTIRTQMQSLKSLRLVEGIPGPKGGYVPTSVAYEVLDIESSNEVATVPFFQNGDRVDDVIVKEFDLVNIHHPDNRHAEVRIQGDLGTFHVDDEITIGPIPASDLVIQGRVDGNDISENILVIEVTGFDAEAS